MERALGAVLDRFGLTDAAPELLQGLAEEHADLFFVACLARLENEDASAGYRKRSLRVLDSPAFLLGLVRSERFNSAELKALCASYVLEDSLLDVKLARLMPGRRSDAHRLPTDLILRILDVLDEISPGPRLLMIIGHLTQHPDRHIASKAALLVGRRLQSREWVERHLASTDPRVRANVAEALWGIDSALAAHTLRKCLHDENNRVQGNAIIGLHRLGDRNVRWRIRHLAKDKRPEFRRTAAWVIGTLDSLEYKPLLEELLLDSDWDVRQAAQAALQRLSVPEPDEIDLESGPNIGIEVALAAPGAADAEAAPSETAASPAGSDVEANDSSTQRNNSPGAANGSGVRYATRS